MITSPIASFPEPYPGECFGGVALRFWELYGASAPRRFLFQKLNIRLSDITGIPTALARIVERIPSYSETSIDSLLEKHTAWPFYRPFLTDSSLRKAWKKIVQGPKGSMQLTLGDAASRLSIKRGLQICVSCAAIDREIVGRPFFHIEHQLPGVVCCPIHGTELLRNRDVWRVLDRLDVIVDSTSPIPASNDELKLARLASSLLSANLHCIENDLVVGSYLERLRSLNLITKMGRVRYGELQDRVAQTFSQNMLIRIGGAGKDAQNWYHSILFRPDRSHHPVKHLLLIGAIYGTIDAFQGALMQRELVFNTKKDAPPKRDISVDVRRASADTGKSFTQIADELGLSVTTCITHAKRQGMNVPSRPKLLTRDLIRRIGNLAAKGISAKTIANDASISAVTVYRVIRSDRAIEQSWKQAREQVARARHRSIWSKKMGLSTQRGVKALRQRAPATYAWLYRHDRDWLNTHKPIA